ncbi:hypothetical protein [Dyadobacter sp. 3J3]|uniref:hypothetical protein n=1 Tax=Dyadobacter sp. 3J3 TaxID=2606600 RepID=UPI0013596092|nr:hypothetical protein [Dyadobacter sp. 3J3]
MMSATFSKRLQPKDSELHMLDVPVSHVLNHRIRIFNSAHTIAKIIIQSISTSEKAKPEFAFRLGSIRTLG